MALKETENAKPSRSTKTASVRGRAKALNGALPPRPSTEMRVRDPWEHPDDFNGGATVRTAEPAPTSGVSDKVTKPSGVTAGAATELQAVAVASAARAAAAPANNTPLAMTAEAAAATGPTPSAESLEPRAELLNDETVAAATDTVVTPVATDPVPTWSTNVETLDPEMLADHVKWAEIAGAEAPEREEELVDDVRDGNIGPEIVTVTGERCWSGPNTVLRGTRYVHALTAARIRTAMVVRRTDLDEAAEEQILVKAALASRHARRLRPSKVAALLGRLYKLMAKGKGFRSDLQHDATCVVTNASADGRRRPDTLGLVARAAHERRNYVADLMKTFNSPIGNLALYEAIDSETLPLSAGAAIVRDIEADPKVAKVLQQAELENWDDDKVFHNVVIQATRARVEARVREQLHKPARKQHEPPANDNNESKRTVEAPGRMEGDSLVLDCLFRARRTRVTVMANVIRLEDLGRDGRKTKAESKR